MDFNQDGRDRRRRRKKELDAGPDPWDLANSVAEYKCFPSDLGPAGCFPPLFPGACSKCSPLGSFYMVDPVSHILGHLDLGQQGLGGGHHLQELVLRLYQKDYSGGIIVSPGQLEVMARAGQERQVVVVTEQGLTSTDLTLLCLSLASQSSLQPPSVPGLGQDWRSRLLVAAGLVAPVGQGGPVISHFSPDLLSSLGESGQEVICVPALVSHLGWGTGERRVRVEVGQPLSLQEILGRFDLTQLSQHLSVSRARAAPVSPGHLVAFVLHSGLSPRQPGVARLLSALTDLTDLLRNPRLDMRKVTSEEEGGLVDVVRAGVAELGGRIDQDEVVHVTQSDLQLWRLSRGLETSLMSQCVVSTAVLGLAKNTVRQSGPVTVVLQQLVDRAKELVIWTGLDTSSLAPCEELDQVIMDAVRRLEDLEGLGNVELPPSSQYGYQGRPRPAYSEEDMREVVVADTMMAVGPSPRGRKILHWLGGLMRYRVTNLAYTARALHTVRQMELATMEEIVSLVRQEIQTKRGRGWRLSEKAAEPEVTRESVVALAQVNIVNIINKSGTEFVQVTHTFNSRDDLEDIINQVLEF